jgi:exopolysaccharide production protein ExoQ
MPPIIALLLCILFIASLLIIEKKWETRVSGALWLPLIWLILSGSRFISEWLNPQGTRVSLEEGSPLDRIVFIGLILGALLVLGKRNIPWGQIIRNNIWLFIFLGYSGLSILWSDYPFVAFKRWVKEIGNIVMIIVILSESTSREGIKIIFRRLGYFLIPLSIVLIKYYPEYGRTYSYWTGEVQYTGVGGNKNYLGFICLTCGYFYLWALTVVREKRNALVIRRVEIYIYVLFLLMVLWLFDKANSATALMSFIAGVGILLMLKISFIKNNIQNIGVYATIACLFGLLIYSLNLDEALFVLLGRESSLTDRVPLWNDIIAISTNPIVGCGYNSFWLGARAEIIWDKWSWHPVNTHSGYLDVYVNLGWIGLILLAALIINTFKKSKKYLINSYEHGRFCVGWLVVVLLYNYTETAFAGQHMVWIVFLLVALEYPKTNTDSGIVIKNK